MEFSRTPIFYHKVSGAFPTTFDESAIWSVHLINGLADIYSTRGGRTGDRR